MHGSTEIIGGKLFRAESAAYSKCVQSFISQYLVTDAQVTGAVSATTDQHANKLLLLFPYNIRDLIDFLRNTTKGIAEQELATLGERGDESNVSGFKPECVEAAITVGKTFHHKLGHFKTANDQCAMWIAQGETIDKIARKICRVIFIRQEDKSRLANDPRYLAHVFLCGLCVPTFMATDLGIDEATYFNIATADKAGSIVNGYNSKTLCLKYSDRSQLLALLGRCEDDSLPSPLAGGQVFETFAHVSQWMDDHLQYEPSEPFKAYERYEVFPLLHLLNTHIKVEGNTEKKISDYFPRYKTYSHAQQETINGYFGRLFKIEHQF